MWTYHLMLTFNLRLSTSFPLSASVWQIFKLGRAFGTDLTHLHHHNVDVVKKSFLWLTMGFVVKWGIQVPEHCITDASNTFAYYTVYQTLASLPNTESIARTGKTAQWAMVLAPKPDGLSWTSQSPEIKWKVVKCAHPCRTWEAETRESLEACRQLVRRHRKTEEEIDNLCIMSRVYRHIHIINEY